MWKVLELKLLSSSALAVESVFQRRVILGNGSLPQSALGLTMPVLLASGQCTTQRKSDQKWLWDKENGHRVMRKST